MAAVPQLPKSFEDAARQHLAVEEELERVCGSPHFRTSKRSCEFLQYIVRVALDGRLDSLKERSIAIDLFGRDSSYEPSSDATVRVRANEVRKRLVSYYAATSESGEGRTLQIDLPTGCYVPRFMPVGDHARSAMLAQCGASVTQPPALPAFLSDRSSASAAVLPPPKISNIPAIQALTLMRPALVALLVCTLLLRHQLENREEYLRFWDRLLSGRRAMVLSVSPQDRNSLASSLYPLVWVAGRYGVDATMKEDSLVGAEPEAASSVQVSYATPPETASDRRLRWVLAVPEELAATAELRERRSRLLDKMAYGGQSAAGALVDSAALLTILPEDSSTLHVQGTDALAIRRLLEDLTIESNFPSGLVERVEHLDRNHTIQVLVYRNPSGEWLREIYLGGA